MPSRQALDDVSLRKLEGTKDDVGGGLVATSSGSTKQSKHWSTRGVNGCHNRGRALQHPSIAMTSYRYEVTDFFTTNVQAVQPIIEYYLVRSKLNIEAFASRSDIYTRQISTLHELHRKPQTRLATFSYAKCNRAFSGLSVTICSPKGTICDRLEAIIRAPEECSLHSRIRLHAQVSCPDHSAPNLSRKHPLRGVYLPSFPRFH